MTTDYDAQIAQLWKDLGLAWTNLANTYQGQQADLKEFQRDTRGMLLGYDAARREPDPERHIMFATLLLLPTCPEEALLISRYVALCMEFLRVCEEDIASQQQPPEPEPPGNEVVWKLTPEGYTPPGEEEGVIVPTSTPILDVYGARYWSSSSYNREPKCERGDVIELGDGEYHKTGSGSGIRCTRGPEPPRGDYLEVVNVADGEGNADYRERPVPMTTFRAKNGHGAVIVAGEGSQCLYAPEVDSRFQWEGVVFRGGSRAVVQTENPFSARWQPYPGGGIFDVQFHRCTFDGEANFLDPDAGSKSTYWGRRGYGHGQTLFDRSWLGGEVFEDGKYPGLVITDCHFKDVFKEHMRYESNIQGNVLFHGNILERAGRSALQITARSNDGPRGTGTIILRRETIRDVCLEQQGGAHAINLKGRNDHTLLIDECDVRLGQDADLYRDFPDRVPTGCLITHASKYPEWGEPGNEAPRSDDPADWQMNDGLVWIRRSKMCVLNGYIDSPDEWLSRSGARGNIHFEWMKRIWLEDSSIKRYSDSRHNLYFDDKFEELRIIRMDPAQQLGTVYFIDKVYDDFASFVRGVRGYPGVEVVT